MGLLFVQTRRMVYFFAIGIIICTFTYLEKAHAATSTVNISVVVDATTSTPSSGGGGGGGGQGFPPGPAFVTFTGYAYPGAIITITQNGAVVATTATNPDGSFDQKIEVTNPVFSLFGLFARDTLGLISPTAQIGLPLLAHGHYVVSNILIGPTIAGPAKVYEEEQFELYGSGNPRGLIRIFEMQATPALLTSIEPDTITGYWRYKIESPGLPNGQYEYRVTNQIVITGLSANSSVLPVLVVERSEELPILPVGGCTGPDLNQDKIVDIIDFSIFIFWWHIPVRSTPNANICVDFVADNYVDLTDFSILMYAWTI